MATIVEDRPAAHPEHKPHTATRTDPLSVGEVAASLLDALASDDLIYLAADEPRALEVVRALNGAAGDALVVYCPSSDSLPNRRAHHPCNSLSNNII